MGITKLDTRRWRARYRDDGGREHRRDFTRKADAEAWLDEITASLVRGDYVDPRRARVLLGTWANSWMEGRVHLKPKTLASYASLLETRVRPRWGSVPLARIAHADVVAWVASMRAEGLSASRVRQAYHLFASMLDAAVRDRRLSSNPAAEVDLPKMRKAEKRYLTHEQLHQLAAAGGDAELLVLTLGYCGLRYGEAAALRVRRVDLMRRRLQVTESMAEIGSRVVFGAPKTHQERSVPVPAFLADRLALHIADRDREAFVFAAPRGGVLRNKDFRRRYFDPAAIAVGLGSMVAEKDRAPRYVGLTPHELRHTAASLAIASGATIKAVQTMLGHASAAMTLDVYGHLFDDELDAVAARLDAAARGAADFSRTRTLGDVVELRASTG